ncbi:hypothetical protein H5410_010608 [Solanum commersonii]|uniref:Uncharacterized protein n=1 Tax=Solanum commersonii TaxID=4109 RepID=A0A9J6AL82_SOLCO|nr:hypothetical protein H5410_010608 [Solanum commersonii]
MLDRSVFGLRSSERKRVAEQQSMSETAQRNQRTSDEPRQIDLLLRFDDTQFNAEDEDDYVDLTP